MPRESYISPQKFVVFRTAGIVPTVPVPPTLRKYHADFLDTDLEIGEWARNIEDNTTFYRNETGIVSYTDRTGIRYIAIGDWDMYATVEIVVSLGANWDKVRSIDAIIFSDLGLTYPLMGDYGGVGSADGTYYIVGANLHLLRRTGGAFDSVDFNATSYNRGYVTAQYII